MTTTELTTNIRTVRQLLKANAAKIEAVLPKHLDAERLMQIAATVVQRTPALAECTPRSLLGSCIQSAQVGLSLDPLLGESYLVPYWDKHSKERRAQFQVGYRGLIRLARNSGGVEAVFAQPVYNGEAYSEKITQHGPVFEHVPGEGPYGPDDLRCVYMVCQFTSGAFHWGRMWKWEIDLIRDRSKASDRGPWVTDYIEMAKKTVVRREAKYLPLSADARQAITNDERTELGIATSDVIDLDQGERPPKQVFDAENDDGHIVGEHNDPNPEAQRQLDELQASLEGGGDVVKEAPIAAVAEATGRPASEIREALEPAAPKPRPKRPKIKKVERGCGQCGLINEVLDTRKTFECDGCGEVTVVS